MKKNGDSVSQRVGDNIRVLIALELILTGLLFVYGRLSHEEAFRKLLNCGYEGDDAVLIIEWLQSHRPAKLREDKDHE